MPQVQLEKLTHTDMDNNEDTIAMAVQDLEVKVSNLAWLQGQQHDSRLKAAGLKSPPVIHDV